MLQTNIQFADVDLDMTLFCYNPDISQRYNLLFHTVIPLDIEFKMNVYKTYVR